MRFTTMRQAFAGWVLRTFFGITPEERFIERALADVGAKLDIRGTLTVIDAQGRVK